MYFLIYQLEIKLTTAHTRERADTTWNFICSHIKHCDSLNFQRVIAQIHWSIILNGLQVLPAPNAHCHTHTHTITFNKIQTCTCYNYNHANKPDKEVRWALQNNNEMMLVRFTFWVNHNRVKIVRKLITNCFTRWNQNLNENALQTQCKKSVNPLWQRPWLAQRSLVMGA